MLSNDYKNVNSTKKLKCGLCTGLFYIYGQKIKLKFKCLEELVPLINWSSGVSYIGYKLVLLYQIKLVFICIPFLGHMFFLEPMALFFRELKYGCWFLLAHAFCYLWSFFFY